MLPSQTSADETKEKRSIELVPLLLLDSHTDINPTQSIPTIITQRYPTASRRNQSVNWDNLVKIHVGTLNSSYIANLSRGKPAPKLPCFYLINARSLSPKMDELSLLLNMHPLDVVAITESWLTNDIIDELVKIDGYNTFRKDRVHGRGGGVCAFVSADIPCKRRQELEDPSFECMWFWLRPVRSPRKISGLTCAILYNPPDTLLPEQNNLVKYVVDKLDVIRTMHPDCGVVLLGDFYRLEIRDLLIHQNLKQIVRTPTHGEHVLDLIVANLHELYNERSIIAPLGRSDHNVVKWTPSASGPAPSHGKSISKKHVPRFPQSAGDAFGRWCNNHTWFADVENLRSCSELACSFSQDLSSAIDQIFPTQMVKIHCSDKP